MMHMEATGKGNRQWSKPTDKAEEIYHNSYHRGIQRNRPFGPYHSAGR